MFFAEVKSKMDEDISILVRLANYPWNYICECGDASGLTIKEIRSCKAIFISHTHIDHFANFDTILRHQIGNERKVIICGPKGISHQIASRIKSYTWNLIEPGAITYEIREIESEEKIRIYQLEPPSWELKPISTEIGNVIYTDEKLEITSILLDHKTPTLAYKFKEQDKLKINLRASGFEGGKWVKELKEAFEKGDNEKIIVLNEKEYKAKELHHLLQIKKGDTIGIIMDHAAHEENHAKIKSHFYECQKVFIESFYKESEKEYAKINYHSYSTMSGKIMRESKVKEAVPVHFSRKYSEEERNELLHEFNTAYKKGKSLKDET